MINTARDNKFNILSFVSVFLIIFVSTETLLFGTNSSETVKFIGYGITFTLTLLWLVLSFVEKKRFSTKTVVWTFAFAALSMITLVGNFDLSIKYFYEMMLILLSACIVTFTSFDSFIKHYRNILVFLAGFSVIVFILYELFYPIFTVFPVVTNIAGYQYYFLGFAFAQKKTMYVEHRNYGLFREPGVFMMFLTVALIFELFYEKKINPIRVLVLVAAMLLTLSTAGYIILLLIALLFLIKCLAEKKNVKLNILLFSIIGVGSVLFLYATDSFSEVFNKLFSDNASRASRFDSIIINIKMIADSVLGVMIGKGYSFVESNFVGVAELIGSNATDNTNTIFRLLSTHGFFYTLSYCYLLFKSFVRAFGKRFMVIALFFIFVLTLFNENFMLNPLIYILIFYSTVAFKSEDKESNACSCD